MNFGEALAALKAGDWVAREGWHARGMHIYLEDGYDERIKAGLYKDQMRRTEPVVCLYTAQGTHQPGWVCSQADMLAEDWIIVMPGTEPEPRKELR